MTVQELEKSFESWWFYDIKDQLKDFIYRRSKEAFIAGDRSRDEIGSVEEVKRRQVFMREKFAACLGGLPDSSTPLNPEITGTIKCDGFRIEKVIFQSRPKAYVTANLYIPDGITSPRGAVLFVCGHHEQGKHVEEYQIVCQYLVRAGLVVLAQDPVGQGERYEYYEKLIKGNTVSSCVFEHDYAGCQCWPLGDGLARYFVHDAMRGVDYLRTRPEVDPDKIGVTGNSGGGTQTTLMMMCDTRIAAAAPATFLMNRETYMYAGMAQDTEQIWPGMTAFGFDHEDILISMVPRPVLVLSVTHDFFPIEGTRLTVERSKRFWDMFGKGNCLEYFEDDSDHHYTRSMAKAAAAFFSLHLLGKRTVPEDDGIRPMEPSLLWCNASGQVRGDKADARSVFDENLARLAKTERTRTAVPEAKRRESALQWLKKKVYAGRKPCQLNPRRFPETQLDELTVQNCIWWAQEGIFNNAFVFRHYCNAGKKLPVTIAIWDGGTTMLQPHIDWIRETCCSGRAVMVLDVSGVGGMLPRKVSYAPVQAFLGIVFKLTHDLMWLDDSMAALRTYDVLRAVDAVALFPGIGTDDIRIYAFGRQGVYGQLAAVLDDRIKGIEVVNGMGSYASWIGSRFYDHHDIMSVVLPGMLKHFDLPDIDKWMGERKI